MNRSPSISVRLLDYCNELTSGRNRREIHAAGLDVHRTMQQPGDEARLVCQYCERD